MVKPPSHHLLLEISFFLGCIRYLCDLLPPGPPLAASVSANGQHPASRAGSTTSTGSAASIDDSEIPRAFICPITCDMFEDPVFTADGMTYEREAIATWLAENRTSALHWGRSTGGAPRGGRRSF